MQPVVMLQFEVRTGKHKKGCTYDCKGDDPLDINEKSAQSCRVSMQRQEKKSRQGKGLLKEHGNSNLNFGINFSLDFNYCMLYSYLF